MNKLDRSQWPISFSEIPCGDDAAQHALDEYPNESCGLIVVENGTAVYVPCRNVAEKPGDQFKMHVGDQRAAEARGEVVALVHSHPDVSAAPSQADRILCEVSELKWYIIAVHKDVDTVAPVSYSEIIPNGYRAPLEGRTFIHGILDCFALIKDYYAWELGIELPEFKREDEWWLKGQTLYLDNYQAAGFAPAYGNIREHDVILMQIRAPTPNHAGIYVGNTQILHHLYSPTGTRLSKRDIYGGYLAEATRFILRHKDLT